MKKIYKLLIFTLSIVSLSSCMTFKVQENNFIKPYSTLGVNKNYIETKNSSYQLKHDFLDIGGVKIYTMELLNKNSKCVIVYLGGNQFSIDINSKDIFNSFSMFSCSIVAFDYRGYGRSEGEPSSKNLISDSKFIIESVAKKFPTKKIIVHGHSLGGFITSFLGKENYVDAIVLESTAPSINEWVKQMVPWYAKPFVSIKYEEALKSIVNLRPIDEAKVPTLVLVGKKDSEAPWKLSQNLYQSSPAQNKWLYVIEQAGHNDVKDFNEFICGYNKLLLALDVFEHSNMNVSCK